MTNYTKGQRTIDDYVAFRIADALAVDPADIIAQANIEREKDPFLVAAITFFDAPSIHIMFSLGRCRFAAALPNPK